MERTIFQVKTRSIEVVAFSSSTGGISAREVAKGDSFDFILLNTSLEGERIEGTMSDGSKVYFSKGANVEINTGVEIVADTPAKKMVRDDGTTVTPEGGTAGGFSGYGPGFR